MAEPLLLCPSGKVASLGDYRTGGLCPWVSARRIFLLTLWNFFFSALVCWISHSGHSPLLPGPSMASQPRPEGAAGPVAPVGDAQLASLKAPLDTRRPENKALGTQSQPTEPGIASLPSRDRIPTRDKDDGHGRPFSSAMSSRTFSVDSVASTTTAITNPTAIFSNPDAWDQASQSSAATGLVAEPHDDVAADVSPVRSQTFCIPLSPFRTPARTDTIDSIQRSRTFRHQNTFPQLGPPMPEEPRRPSQPQPTSPARQSRKGDSGFEDGPEDADPAQSPVARKDEMGELDIRKREVDDFECGDDSEMDLDSVVESRPDDGLIDEMCEHFLKTGFGTALSDLRDGQKAWAAVSRCWSELHVIVDAESPPVDGDDSGASRPSSTFGDADGLNSGAESKRKRAAPNQGGKGDGLGDDGADGDDDSHGRKDKGPTKKMRTNGQGNRLSCPYRKRNPLKFNVRDFPTCACQDYPDMTNLK
jgi:hypothetical protein